MKTITINRGALLEYEMRLHNVLHDLNRDVAEAILEGQDPQPLRLARSAVKEGLGDTGLAIALSVEEGIR